MRPISRNFTRVLAVFCLAFGISLLGANPSLAIVGGKPAEGDGAVLIVGFETRECSGFLYRPKIVVTAAHCVSLIVVPRQAKLLAYPVGAKRGTQPGIAPIATFVGDPNADVNKMNDIAYLVFDRDIGKTNIVGALDFDDYLKLRREPLGLEIVGYGLTGPFPSPLSEVPHRLDYVIPPWKSMPFRERSGFELLDAMACEGDSGGLVAVRDDRGQRVAVGVASRGGNLDCSMPADKKTPFYFAPMDWKLLHQAEMRAGYQPTIPVELTKNLKPLVIDKYAPVTFFSGDDKLKIGKKYVLEDAWSRKEVPGTPAKQRVEYAVRVGNAWEKIGHGQLIPREKFDIDGMINPRSAKTVVAYSLSTISLPSTARIYDQAESRRLVEVFAEKSGLKKILLKDSDENEARERFDWDVRNCPCIVVGYRLTGEKKFANEVLVPAK